jgi:hypothetical protein
MPVQPPVRVQNAAASGCCFRIRVSAGRFQNITNGPDGAMIQSSLLPKIAAAIDFARSVRLMNTGSHSATCDNYPEE